MQKGIFYQMAQSIQIPVIISLFFAVFLGWNHNFHARIMSISNDLIGIIPPIRQQYFSRYALDQVNSFFAISSGTLCDKYSDRHTICIHGKVNLGIEPPFVRLMS